MRTRGPASKDAKTTLRGGFWQGEALIDISGTVAHVWPTREIQLTPDFPPLNNAIVDAIEQWEFEPPVVNGRPTPICTTVTVIVDVQ